MHESSKSKVTMCRRVIFPGKHQFKTFSTNSSTNMYDVRAKLVDCPTQLTLVTCNHCDYFLFPDLSFRQIPTIWIQYLFFFSLHNMFRPSYPDHVLALTGLCLTCLWLGFVNWVGGGDPSKGGCKIFGASLQPRKDIWGQFFMVCP